MPNKAMKPKRLPLNPNWLQLQEKLKTQGGFRPRKPSTGSETGTLKNVLGKRKERSEDDDDDDEEESNGSKKSVLTPINSDCSVTNEIAMDCEMVGVSSEGNKSALGRVSVVRVCVRMQCQPLSETQYKPIINDNFYSAFHFWFELDHAQTCHLISLFESLPVIHNTSHSTISGFPNNAFKWKPKQPLVARNEDESPKEIHGLVSDEDFPCLNHSNICMDEGNHMTEGPKPHLDKEVAESAEQHLLNQLQQLVIGEDCSESHLDENEKVIDDPHVTNDILSGDGCSPEVPSIDHEDIDVPSATSDNLLEDDCLIEAPFVSSHKIEDISVNLSDHQSLVDQVNMWGNVIYDEFVRPVERVVDYRTEISGIRPRDLRKAKDFQVVQKDVSELIKGKILVGHALRNDLKALLLSHSKNYTRDTSEFHSFLKEGRKRSLRSLAAEFLNVNIQDGEHCPIQDAQAAMLLYQKNKKEWERGIKDHLRFKGKNKGKRPKKQRSEPQQI